MRTINNFTQFLDASVTAGATSLTLDANRSRLGFPSAADPVVLTLTDRVDHEVVHVVGLGAGAQDVDVLRGREGTTARSWPSGTKIEARPTAGLFARGQSPYGETSFNSAHVSGDLPVEMGGDPALYLGGVSTGARSVTLRTPLDDAGNPIPGSYHALVALADKSGEGATGVTTLQFTAGVETRQLHDAVGAGLSVDTSVRGIVWRVTLLVLQEPGREIAMYEVLA